MKNTYIKIGFISLVLFLMLGMTPASSRQAAAASDHPMDQALLLMFSSHMRMIGEVESARISSAHLAAPSSQTQADIDNEINAVIDLYVAMIANLQASGNYSRAVEDQLVAQMNEKVDALQAKAQALAAKRSNSSRGGFIRSIGRAFNRVVKAVGRGTGWVVGKAMDGAAEVGVFAVEEVTPQVLREYALGGAPLNAKLFRHVARELLKKRVTKAAENNLLRLAERIARRQAAQGEALPTLDPVAQATQDAWEADFIDLESASATEEAHDATQGAGQSGGSSSGGSSTGEDVVVYDFTASDMYNFTESWIGVLLLEGYTTGDGYSCNSARPWLDGAVLHLEFDRSAETVSGWLEGNSQEVRNAKDDIDLYNLTGSFRVTFNDLPVIPTNDSKIAFMFEGYGEGTATITGSVLCQKTIIDTGEWLHYMASVQKSNNNRVPVNVKLYHPGTIIGDHAQSMIVLSGGAVNQSVEPQDGFSYEFYYRFDRPFEEMVP
ncbi:MAG: hypothetical protein JW757_10035 [Anaerolineales bacterium]|nr:hypothetical protein [Anaerolineales bacterium]